VIVASLNEATLHSYTVGFPLPGHWHETFNSDYYDHYPNPWVQGNTGEVSADGAPLHGMPHSAQVTIPANSLLVFTRDLGD
jgi:1,4-alpha-glucan branching enzyme